MTFDLTINLGNILSLVVLLCAFFAARKKQHQENLERLERIDRRIAEMKQPFELMWRWFKREHGINGEKNNE